MTKGEFTQIIVNILNKYIADNYKTNWTTIKNWIATQTNDVYIANTFNQDDKQLIEKKIKEC